MGIWGRFKAWVVAAWRTLADVASALADVSDDDGWACDDDGGE